MRVGEMESEALDALISACIERGVGERVDAVESRLVGLTDAVTSLGGKVTGLEVEVRDLKARVTRVHRENMKGRSRDVGELAWLRAQITALTERLEALERGGEAEGG